MQIYLRREGREDIPLVEPYDGAPYVENSRLHACEGCEECMVYCRTCETVDDRRKIGTALCYLCDELVGGVLVVEIDTLFGIEEDRRVLMGRPRVY